MKHQPRYGGSGVGRRRSGLLVALLVAALAGTAAATTIAGTVVDATDGQPLPFTTVALEGGAVGTLSGDAGAFRLTGVAPGPAVLVFSHVGYATRRDTVVVGTTPVRLQVALQPQAITIGQESVIQAQRPPVAGRTQTSAVQLDVQDIASLPAVGEPDLLRTLQLLPGVQTASDISSGLYVRGGGPDQNLVLLDGMPVYNPSHAFGFFSTFNPDAVGDVTLIKGAYPAAYSGNLGAVLDVSNRIGSPQQVSGRGGISLISGRTTLEGPVGRGSWLLGLRRTYLDPVLDALRAADVDVPSYYFYDVNARLDQQITGRDRFSLSVFRSRDALGFDSDQETYFDLGWGNRALAARLQRVYSPQQVGSLLLGYSEYRSTTTANFFATPVRFANRIRDLTARADLEQVGAAGRSRTVGLAATAYDVQFSQEFNQEASVALERAPYLLTGYAQEEWQPDVLTTVRLGVRASYFSGHGRVTWMPRLGLQRSLTDRVQLLASAGVYRQYLQLVSTEGFSGGDFWVPLDGTAAPGRSYQAVVGLEWNASDRYRAVAEAYYSRLHDLVVLDNTTAADSRNSTSAALFRTGGSGRARGLELFVERRTGRWRGWLGYTLGWTERRFAELNAGRPFPPKYDRRHDASFVLTYSRGRYTLGSSFVYGTGQAFTPAAARYTLRAPGTGRLEDSILPAARNSGRLLPYHRLDVSARRAITLGPTAAELFVQVFNVYSRRNEWFVQYDTDDPATQPEVVKMLPIVPTVGLNFSF